MHTGKIKKLIIDKGFGFIADTDGSDVFFHKTSLEGVEFGDLVGNEEVEFEVQQTPKGRNATHVKVINKS